jgi:DNA-binding MarR family transcriptional regulator
MTAGIEKESRVPLVYDSRTIRPVPKFTQSDRRTKMAATSKRKASAASQAEEPSLKKKNQRTKFPLTISRPELLVNGSDREFRHLVHSLLGFLARHEQLRQGHGKVIGLAGIEYTTLISIAHLSVDGDVNVKTVADHLHLSGAFVTSLAQRLLKLGLIHKRTDPADRRRVTLTVSAKGHALLEKLAPMQRKVNNIEFGCLNRHDLKYLIEKVDQLIECSDRALALQAYLLAEENVHRS